MKAMAFHEYGSPEVLTLTDMPAPTAGPGEVRLRVRAAGVQPFDYALRAGGFQPSYLTVTFPVVLGNEFAGVVDQLGEGVTGFAVGDEVLGFGTLGSYAEYRTSPADQIVPKPAGVPWEVAGGFTAGAQTAHMALTELGVRPGGTVLVHAAAGGVGTVAVQLARLWGAGTVIGTASEPNHEYLRGLGAVPVTYGPGLLDRVRALAPDGVDAVVDGAGGEALDVSLELVPRERIRELVDHERAVDLGIPQLVGPRSAARLAELVDLAGRGLLKVHVRRTFPLVDAAAAHREGETGHGAGKLVLVV